MPYRPHFAKSVLNLTNDGSCTSPILCCLLWGRISVLLKDLHNPFKHIKHLPGWRDCGVGYGLPRGPTPVYYAQFSPFRSGVEVAIEERFRQPHKWVAYMRGQQDPP